MATEVGDKTKTSLDMVYIGLEDGRFMGYSSATSYTARNASGSAADLPWAPYVRCLSSMFEWVYLLKNAAHRTQTVDIANGVSVCAAQPACTGVVGEACTAASGAPQSAADSCAAADLSNDPAADRE